MKKKNILLLLFGFIFFKLSYYYSIQYFIEGNVSPGFKSSSLLMLFFVIVYSVYLWNNAPEGFSEIKAKTIDKVFFVYGEIMMILISVQLHYKYLPFFETNQLVFVGLGVLDVVAMTIFIYMCIKSFQLSNYFFEKNKGINQSNRVE